MRAQFTRGFEWRLNVRNTKCKHKYSLDLLCFENTGNFDDVFDIINIARTKGIF